MKLSIGTAVCNDPEGLTFTLQSLRINQLHYTTNKEHPNPDVELIVVDNDPSTQFAQPQTGISTLADARYIPYSDVKGTSASRNKILDVAKGEWTLVLDSHVLLGENVIDQIIAYIDESRLNPANIYSGPLLLDHLKGLQTHFNDVWSAEMRGRWGVAWRCRCKQHTLFSVIDPNDTNKNAIFVLLPEGKTPIRSLPCGCHLPSTTFPGHESILMSMSYYPISIDDPEFEIPGQGLGCFLVHTKTWPGFIRNGVGFGGEELCIHDLYRQMGGKAICLPWLTWWHRFMRPFGVMYTLSRYHKVRNYILWYRRLGYPLTDIENHFVKGNLLKKEEWNYLLSDVVNNTDPPAGCGSCNSSPKKFNNAVDMLEHYISIDRDLNKHLRRFVSIVEHYIDCTASFETQTDLRILDLSIRKESSIAFAIASGDVRTTCTEITVQEIEQINELTEGGIRIDRSPTPDFDPEILFINQEHTAASVAQSLSTYVTKSTALIILHNTDTYGEIGEDGGKGILYAVRDFIKQHPEWTPYIATNEQHGLLVLSLLEADKKDVPSLLTRVGNFAKSLTKHLGSGANKVSEERYTARLDTCALCPLRNVETCSVCGCDLKVKASWESSSCPIGSW